MSGFGAGVRRGVMAGDQFTQIANGLFRDSQISYRAKGLFGYISTHRDGWQVTVANLARHGRERVDAVTTGLEELEKHGFLLRDRDRNADGTLGPALYFITDLPALQNPSSQGFAGFLRQDLDAVTAGLTLQWGSGDAEGHVNRVKHSSEPCLAQGGVVQWFCPVSLGPAPSRACFTLAGLGSVARSDSGQVMTSRCFPSMSSRTASRCPAWVAVSVMTCRTTSRRLS